MQSSPSSSIFLHFFFLLLHLFTFSCLTTFRLVVLCLLPMYVPRSIVDEQLTVNRQGWGESEGVGVVLLGNPFPGRTNCSNLLSSLEEHSSFQLCNLLSLSRRHQCPILSSLLLSFFFEWIRTCRVLSIPKSNPLLPLQCRRKDSLDCKAIVKERKESVSRRKRITRRTNK
jgi:hypothetical protein